MKKLFVGVALAFSFTVLLIGPCFAVDLGIITGKEKGTYYQFGLNLKALMEQHDIQLSVHPSNGSVENIHAVFKRPGTQLGIVQSDVLAFASRVQSNETLKAIARKVKMVFPLYNEEIHLLAREGITSFDDLAGRRVAVGEEGSGTYLTSRLLFQVSKVKPKEMVNIGTDKALAQLKAGHVDAIFYVAGSPVKLFTESVTEADGLQIVPIVNQSLFEFYPRVQIPAGTYAWQQEAVDTIAVKAVLVTYDFRTAHCENVGRFARIMAENMDGLINTGHPKWKSVDLFYHLKGWDQYDCVQKQMAQSPATKDTAQLNPVLDAMRQLLE
jgi:uncharacterized protein